MDNQSEPLPQLMQKDMKHKPPELEWLSHLGHLVSFINKFAPEALRDREGDYFPVRKIVGRRR